MQGFVKWVGTNGKGKDCQAQNMNGMCKGVAVSCVSPVPHLHPDRVAVYRYSVCPDLDSHDHRQWHQL